jgi:predicted Zn-dependent peptidase
MGLLDLILVQGDDARLHEALVREHGMTGSVSGGINVGLGHMLNYNGPMLWTSSLFHDSDTSADAILAVVDSVIEGVRASPLDEATLERARVKVRSRLYDATAAFFGFGRADLLASFALFDDDPSRINRLEEEFARVTPELLQATAREYLRPTNRSVLEIVPGAAAPAATEVGR